MTIVVTFVLATLRLLVLPPAVVMVTLLVCHSAWATFLLYHLGICLVWPLLYSLLVARQPWKEHFRRVGLRGGRTRAGVMVGLLIGAVMAAGQWFGFMWLGPKILAGQRVLTGLALWGVDATQVGLLLGIMLLLNGPAEELYWRGYVHDQLVQRHPRPAVIAATALAYASYHGMTLMVLLGSWPVAAGLLLVVFGAGCLWGWARERYGCVWPALLGHTGATLGYMLAFWQRFGRG